MSSLSMYDPATWERVRDDYLCGMTAAEVCRRHGVSRSQVYAQARAGGWRRADQLEAAAGLDAGAPAPPTHQLAADALRRAAAALALGRLAEARGWTRLVADLRALAVEEVGASDWSHARGRVAAEALAASATVDASTSPPEAGLPDAAGPASPVAPAAQPVAAQGLGGEAPDSPASPAAPPQSGGEAPRVRADLGEWRDYAARMRAVRPGDPLWAQAREALALGAALEAELGPLGLGPSDEHAPFGGGLEGCAVDPTPREVAPIDLAPLRLAPLGLAPVELASPGLAPPPARERPPDG